MSPCGGDRHRAFGRLLTAHLGKINIVFRELVEFRAGQARRGRNLQPSLQKENRFLERRDRNRFDSLHERGLARVLDRHEEPSQSERLCGARGGQNAATRARMPVEIEFADRRVIVEAVKARQSARGDLA